MTWSRRRRSASQEAVNWRGDSIPRDFESRGEPLFRSTPAQGVPPAQDVRRLQRLASLASSDPVHVLRGMGSEPAPHVRPRTPARLPFPVGPRTGPRLFQRPPTPTSPIDWWRRDRSWQEFKRLRVERPAQVAFCVRRKQRRGVLFALGIGGKRGLRGRGGGYRRTENSLWGC